MILMNHHKVIYLLRNAKILLQIAVLSLRVQIKAHEWLFGKGQTTYSKLKNILMTNGYRKKLHFYESILTGLIEKSNKIFNRLCSHRLKSESELKYFTYNIKKATNLEKLYFLPKVHKRLTNIPGRPVISNCGTPTEKISEYLDFLLKPVMQVGWSYIKDPGDFLKKSNV